MAGGSAYPELPVGPDRVALTSTPASAPAVPGPRLPSAGEDGPPTRHLSSPAAPVNPDVELDLAHRAAAAADEAAAQVEELAQQPALLPGSSPFSRAIVVYVGFIAAGNLAQALLALVAKAGAVDGFTLYAWMLAGLPALTFFAAYFALGAWGRARIGAADRPGTPGSASPCVLSSCRSPPVSGPSCWTSEPGRAVLSSAVWRRSVSSAEDMPSSSSSPTMSMVWAAIVMGSIDSGSR